MLRDLGKDMRPEQGHKAICEGRQRTACQRRGFLLVLHPAWWLYRDLAALFGSPGLNPLAFLELSVWGGKRACGPSRGADSFRLGSGETEHLYWALHFLPARVLFSQGALLPKELLDRSNLLSISRSLKQWGTWSTFTC